MKIYEFGGEVILVWFSPLREASCDKQSYSYVNQPSEVLKKA